MILEPKLKILHDLVKSSSKEEVIWMNGYLSGLVSNGFEKQELVSLKTTLHKITIVYGTETGNSKKLAADFAAQAKKNRINAKLLSLDQYRLNDLQKEEYFFIVISTQGEGEPPLSAQKFYNRIYENGLKLDKLKYGVLALGDTAYPLFCKAGEDVDTQLHKLGASRIAPLQKCDTDFENDAHQWFTNVFKSVHLNGSAPALENLVPAKKISGKKMFKGKILTNINLNARGSNKQTHHIEIAVEDIEYKPGDSIGIHVPEKYLSTKDPIAPRLYSISSSLEAYSNEVHITVARNTFKVNDELKYGLCSNFLLQLKEDEELDFYVHKNNLFRLPDSDKDIIMVGPGTGIAPFRSFLAERDATGASGKNWLFFGEQHFVSDFLYQTEIQNWASTGVLTKTNVAFSRDQEEKIYVQDMMMKNGADFFEWMDAGAYLYVCGAKEPMSVDVENTILQIIEQFGNYSSKSALKYLDELRNEGRYLKDVY